MLYFKALSFALLSTLALVRADDQSKCSTELQGIVFEPQTYALDYMRKIAANFNIGAALLFTPQADSYINSFQQEWGVTVSIATADNICTTDAENSAAVNCQRDVMRAVINFPGFRFDALSQNVYYSEDLFDPFGNFRQVTISRPVNGVYLKK